MIKPYNEKVLELFTNIRYIIKTNTKYVYEPFFGTVRKDAVWNFHKQLSIDQ